jgi:sugar phosphate isomerase/epimerase
MAIKLAASSMLTRGKTLTEQIDFLHSCGFSGMELRLTLGDGDLPAYLENLNQVLDRTGVSISSLIMPDSSFSQSFDSREAMEAKLHSLQRNLHIAGPLGAVSLFCPEYRAQQPLPLWNPPSAISDKEQALLVELLSRAAETAEQVGGIIVIEPLNRYETHILHTLESAMQICELVGSPRVGILADFYHMNLEEADIRRSIIEAAGRIYHVQVADSNRLLPGLGHMDFRPGFQALLQTGYDRFIALECRAQGPVEEDLPHCIEFLNSELLFLQGKK